jgi:formylglycine-generating enzyme required for sulfatase activity
MDTYEVTVERFRSFVAGYPGNKPLGGMGKAPQDPSDPGWNAAWNTILPADQATLMQVLKTPGDCDGYTWTDNVGSNEYLPINCVSWYEAFAFCIWDDGRLPTEAEWNYAAAGGDQQRVYPWSFPASSTTIDATYAVYSPASLVNVGSKSPQGDGRWVQSDLAGSLWEWVLDWYAPQYPTPCVNCANHTPAEERVLRGGGFHDDQDAQRTTTRDYSVPASRNDGYGIRCVRNP